MRNKWEKQKNHEDKTVLVGRTVVDMGIILKCTLETRSGEMWNGFNYIRQE
jgi:hypothetical protein